MKSQAFIALIAGLCIVGCDDTTDTLGVNTNTDYINSVADVFTAFSRSLVADSVMSNSNHSYLGRITDEETGKDIQAEFLAQFAILENYEFPSKDLMVETNGELADSVELRLYYESYYGDGNNPMKVEVHELDTLNIIREDTILYSNADLTRYVKNQAKGRPLTSAMFTARDLTLSDNTLESNSYSPNIRIRLPKEYGTFLIRKYYENPDFYRNSYNFIRHVCPGFYFKLADGKGTMIKMRVGAVNLFFKYRDVTADTLCVGMTRFAATPEVLQNTYIENTDMTKFVQDNPQCTYLKTPAGVFTEVELPIDEIYREHELDSISQAQVTFYRYNNTPGMNEDFGIPQTLLMVRKSEMHSFFENQKVVDGKTSYTASFNSTYNTYAFSNIGNLVAACRRMRNEEAKKAKMTVEDWTAAHADWNKVVLIPVDINTDDKNNIVSVTHDMGLGSSRLFGGTGSDIKIQVIYSSFR